LTGIASAYGIFSVIFTLSALMVIRKKGVKLLTVGFFLFLCMHIVSLLYNVFPEDLPGTAMTFRGLIHWVVTGAIVPLTISSILVIGLGFRKVSGFKGYVVYSVITSIILFTAGGTTVIILSQGLSYFGLFERINIGSLQLWMFIMSLKLFMDSRDKVIRGAATVQNTTAVQKI
jgi:hypothetical protein